MQYVSHFIVFTLACGSLAIWKGYMLQVTCYGQLQTKMWLYYWIIIPYIYGHNFHTQKHTRDLGQHCSNHNINCFLYAYINNSNIKPIVELLRINPMYLQNLIAYFDVLLFETIAIVIERRYIFDALKTLFNPSFMKRRLNQ